MYMQNQKKIQISLFTKQIQTHRHGKQTWLPKGKGGRDKLGIWNEQIDTTIYKKDNQEGPTVQHRRLYSVACNNL